MSNLEKYILENRDELDRMEAVPEEAIWQKIRAQQLPQKQPVAVPSGKLGFNWKILSIAALMLALAGWGLWFFTKVESATPTPLQTPPTKVQAPIAEQPTKADEQVPVAEQKAATTATSKVAEASPKVKSPIAKQPNAKRQPKVQEPIPPTISEDERLLQQLVAKKQQEIGLDTLDRAAYADLLRELDELEISVQEARRDHGSGLQRERLMETLIRYYELKIRILEQINYEINKKEYHEALEKRI